MQISARQCPQIWIGGGASYTLIGAIMLLGGIGYAIDRWRGTSPWFLLGGLLLGMSSGFTIWQKPYGAK